MTTAAPSSRSVLITGDVVVDHHLYEGERPKPNSADGRGVLHRSDFGGAAGLCDLLDQLGTQAVKLHADAVERERKAKEAGKKANDPGPAPAPLDCTMGVHLPDRMLPYAPHHAFTVWRPHKMTSKRDEKRQVWRADLALGYGHDPIDDPDKKHEPTPAPPIPRPYVLVLDDAGSLFRKGKHRACWHLPRPGGYDWILLKHSDPIAQGDWWPALVPAHRDRLVVLVSATDLRREQVRIGQKLSWERTLEDLADALERPALKALKEAAHLVVSFGGDAALWLPRGAGIGEFCFSAADAEGDFAAEHEGGAIGYQTCMAPALAYGLAQSAPDAVPKFKPAMERGLRGMRDLLRNGHGAFGPEPPAGFPAARLAGAMLGAPEEFAEFAHLTVAWPPPEPRGAWMMVESSQRPLDSGGPRPLIGLATEVLRRGKAAYRRLPHVRFGKFVTAERGEIEALRGIRQLMRGYRADTRADKPLSIGVFGPPGAGKSFAVKEIATGEFDEKCWLEFNLSQFEDEHDLIGAFHQVRDRALSRVMPVVFWDEFDAREHHWLRYLLAPMQDGRFQEGQVTHPIGHAIFVFAGGVSPSYQLFGPLGDTEDDRNRWRASKGRDFKSRLDAFYDVTGPNPRPDDGKTPGSFDIGYPLRRALMMRGKLAHDLDDVLPIDGGLANALLLAPEYIHGARSIDKLVKPLAPAPKEPVRRSNLPPDEQIRMHTDLDSFRRHLEQEAGFMNSGAIEELAEAIHASWPNFKEQPGVNKSAYFNQEWEKLDEVAREDNRAAARRIPAVLALAGLALAGLGVSTDAAAEAPSLEELEKHLEHNLERLAEAEHDGWCDFRIRNGWRYDPERDDGEKRHPLLVPYDKLEEHVKDKDRDAVRNYPARVILADFRIVWLGEPQRAAATP